MAGSAVKEPPVRAKRPARKGAAAAVAAASSSTSAATALPLALVDATHFTNPRGDVDTKSPSFDELVGSIKDLGVLQPIVVGPALVESGKHPIIAGWRRYAAAVKLKLPSIPVHQVLDVTEAKAALAAALAENAAREDVTPLAEARAIDTLMREHGYTQVQAGQAIGMAERTVRERLRLLKIEKAAPAAATAISEGTIPMDAAVQIQAIAAVSPGLAEDLIAKVDAGEIKAQQLTTPEGVRSLVIAAAGAKNTSVFAADPDSYNARLTGTRAPLTPEQLKRWKAVPPENAWGNQPPSFQFTKDDLVAAKKAGCLLEIKAKAWEGGAATVHPFIVDRGFVAGLLEPKLAAMEKAGKSRAKDFEKRKAEEAERRSSGDAARNAEKEKRARDREIGVFRNQVLVKRADRIDSLTGSLEAAQLLALLVLGEESELVGAGLLQCAPDIEDAELDVWQRAHDLHDEVVAEVLKAKTPEGALRPVLRAVVLARVATELSGTFYSSVERGPSRSDEDVPKLADALAVKAGILEQLDEEAAALAASATPATAEAPKRTGKRPTKDQVLEAVKASPGVTISELAEKFGIAQNFLYRLLPELQKAGQVVKVGRGWEPKS